MEFNIKKLLSEKSLICSLLDVVDIKEDSKGNFNGSKRKHAHITEKFFENRILPIITNSEYVSRGWIRFSEFGNKSKVCWIKVVFSWNENINENKVDKAFISEVLTFNPKIKFYTLGLDKYYCYTLRQLLSKENGKFFCKVNTPPFINFKGIQDELNRLNGLIYKPAYSDELGFCEPWLESCPVIDVFTLLTERILMNKGLFGCTDIDAIEYNPDSSKKIIFHEFKRKYPFKDNAFSKESIDIQEVENYDFRTKLQNNLNELLVNENILTKQKKTYTLAMDKGVAYAKIDEYLNSIEYSTDDIQNGERKEYFGIDGSHCETIELCLSMGFRFTHTIWDSKKTESPYELLNTILNPTELVHLYSKSIHIQDLTKITRTVGPDSGSFNHGVRIQFTIDANEMRKSSHRTISPT
jgi:hypothetical protein